MTPEEQLQNALVTTFFANLAFLSEYDNELYHRIDELSNMINDGTYKERYQLEFIQENGEFDIYDLINDKFIYNKNPNKMNKDLISKVEFDEKSTIFTLENIFAEKMFTETFDENVKYNIDSLAKSNYLTKKDISEYANITKDYLENSKKRLKRINKFVFLGTLLGRHIPKIVEKVDADLYLVCERNLEIFRLSLFTVDYTILLKKKGVIFSIMDSDIEEEKKIFDFLNINPLENYLIKLSTTGINIDRYVDKLLSILVSIKPTSYDYNRLLYTHMNRVSKVLNSEYNVLLLNKIKKEFNLFENIPVLYLAAGPSLDENIEWIKENQHKFFIVTIGAAYKKLIQNKIKIDIIVTLDEQFDILNRLQFDDESICKIPKNTIVIASSITDSRILNKFNKDRLFLYEVFNSFHIDNMPLGGFSVGELTILLLLNMNVKELYLIGLDLALNQKTGKSHSENSNSGTMSFNLNDEKQREEFGLRKGVIKVKGNFIEEVYTTSLFYTSIKYLQNFLFEKEKDVNIYNLSSHGAYFDNTITKEINKIEINKFKDIQYDEKVLLKFKENSLKNLSFESKKSINDEIELIEKIIKDNIENFRTDFINNYEEFYTKAISLISLIIDDKLRGSLLSIILRNYSLLLFPYLSYHFNDKKIKDENKKVIKIQKVFLKHLETILKDYLTFLNELLK